MKTMLAQLVGSILRLKYKLFAKHPSINVVEQLVRTENVLIFMPNKIEHFGAALKSLENLRKLKPNWKITVITKLEMVTFIDSNLKVDILPYSNDDLNFFGLPKESIKRLFDQTTFDLALDLKLTFDIISIILFQLSGAPLKVSFDSTEKAPFYNFGIRVDPAETLTNKYNAIVKYITLIASSPTKEQPISNAVT